ncbi:MAG: guanylate kinase [Bacteroidales bacterium]|nr:guanylate kinase [Bacteroidales bacterium]MBO7487334.1 guanylate kinase [Bacteroidales bacterium]
MSKKVVIFSAPSGSGKTTVVKHLISKYPRLEFSISATSRQPRGAEVDGKDYYFLSEEEFKARIAEGQFVEYEQVYQGSYYGTLKSEVERIWSNGNIILFDVDVKGGVNLKKYFGENALSVFIQAPSPEELRRRLEKRGTDSPEAIERRVAKAAEEMEYADQFDVVLINDDLDTCLRKAEHLPIFTDRTVALYFGTFNPLHIGHVNILRYLAGCGLDEVRMIVSPQSPFKEEASSSDEKRLADVRKKIAKLKLDVTVSDIEYQLERPSYTINTLRHLQAAEPDTHFILVMGADNLEGFKRWKDWQEIVTDYEIWVYPRPGVENTPELCKDLQAKLLDAPLTDISSTEIRNGQKTSGLD